MNKLVIIAIAFATLSSFAQQKQPQKLDRENRAELRKSMTPTEIADLKSKQLTLKLDLNDEQQKKVHQLILNGAEDKQSLRQDNKTEKDDTRKKPSKDEMLKMKSQKLDMQIEMKREMKKILTEEQFAKFEKMQPRKQKRRDLRHKTNKVKLEDKN
ncbi:hypothetical protein [Winogradskyella bathintestinalis]|uniref:DUF4890 domain-containing protein n=1 Tax=Winogradskyella bathintestinalis TaxID=3035208 RepID=A0ABT7ZXS5_9FLAO|nr:hypothetical protein [Winogradskyella bathintestinalis]MDN3493813.1 hypothetical protein [Winogradskyella bathintestinalis]